jgi:hypothetical protein
MRGSSAARLPATLLRQSIHAALAVPLWIGFFTSGVTAALSECQRCEETGDCSTAYRGSPGQFCGHWLDRANQRQSCCCPVGAVCRVSNYACNCAAVGNAGPGRRARGDEALDPLLWLWWLLGALALVACCAGCIYMFCSRNKQGAFDDREEAGGVTPVPIAYPVNNAPLGTPNTVYGTAPAAASYGTAPPLYATPGLVTPAYGAGGYGGGYGGGMGAGTGAVLGGTAGLLGGVLLGEALADAGRGSRGVYDGGGFVGDSGVGGGGGGFDTGVGDFGGDF